MFSEILKIIPKLDPKDLTRMQNALQSRFTRLTKSFGKGLVNVLKGGGIAGIALGLIDKLLNPLKEVQEAIDRTLKGSDDLATNARQFNTTAGKLSKLVTIGKATGLDESGLYTMISKFQGAVAAASANPNDPANNSVKNYVGQADTAEAFFGFIQELQKMDKNQQRLIQEQVFGEKLILKMADLAQTIGDPESLAKLVKETGMDKVTSTKLTNSIDKLSNLNDLQDALAAGRDMRDMIGKSGSINEGMIRARDKTAQLELDRENQRIKSYTDLAAISNAVTVIMTRVEEGLALFGKFVALITPLVAKIDEIHKTFVRAPIMRGIRGLFGQGKDD